MSILGKALAGAGRATRESMSDLMRAEIMRLRDERLAEYQRAEGEATRQFQAGEKEKDRKSAEQIASERNETSVKVAQIEADSRIATADKRAENAGSDRGKITQQDGITKVLQPRYGGTFEGGVWFPDEKNRDVALRAAELYEQFTSGANAMPFISAARKAAEQAEREAAMGTLPIGRAPGVEPKSGEGNKSFRHLWSN